MRLETLPLTDIKVLAPTRLEQWAAQRTLVGRNIELTGVGLKSVPKGSAPLVVCGLAGGLQPGLTSGTVFLPETVDLPDGSTYECDRELVAMLSRGAKELGFHPVSGRLLTTPRMVTGEARRKWADRGFAAADMETAIVAQVNPRVATVRVILDSVERSIAAEWERPAQVLFHPSVWTELLWLSWAAPLYALRAARVLEKGLASACDG